MRLLLVAFSLILVLPLQAAPEGARIVQAGRLELERGIMVKGRVRREDDRQAPRLKLWFTDKARQMQDVETNGQSEFSIGPLRKGPWEVSVEGSAGWKIVPEETIHLEGRADVPQLVITVRQGERESLKGRVVTAEGKPIPNARVVANVYDAFRGSVREDRTDGEGFYVLSDLTGLRDVKITQVIAGGYALLQIGEATRKTGKWLATDVIMARRDAQVSGRIVDANGVPQAGVLVVSSEQMQFRPVTTKEDGAFQIDDLLGGDITVLAARGREFGEVVMKAGQHNKPVEVRLQLPGSFIAPMQQQLLERVAKEGFGYSWPASWNELGTERVLHLCLQKDGVLPPGVPPAEFEADEVNWALAGDAMRRFWWWAAKHDPLWTAQYAPRYLSLTPEKIKSRDTWISAITRVASAVAANGNEQQRAWSAEWLNAALKVAPLRPQKSSDAARYWFQVAAVSYALKRPDAEQHLLAALTEAADSIDKGELTLARVAGTYLAAGGEEPFALIDKEWPAKARRQALLDAILETAPHNPVLAKRFFQRLEMPQQDVFWPHQVHECAIAMAPRDAAIALSWLKQLPSEGGQSLINASTALMRVARFAVHQKKFDVAREALLPLLQIQSSSVYPAYAGLLAQSFDTELAEQFFAKATQPHPADDTHPMYSNTTIYARSIAVREPALGRLMLEFAAHRATQVEAHQGDNELRGLAKAAATLGTFDLMHAAQLLAASPQSHEEGHAQARAFLVAYLCSDEETRRFMLFDK